uniref:Uncharacterized protein n=1 Tax=Knipowitschia caucasica TaxID=637954 RepID=A0AAV2LJL9_KNICA
MGFHNVDWGRLEDSFSSHHKRVAVRQQEIVISAPPVENVKARWPALHTERQVLAEFNQITSSKLGNDFVSAQVNIYSLCCSPTTRNSQFCPTCGKCQSALASTLYGETGPGRI